MKPDFLPNDTTPIAGASPILVTGAAGFIGYHVCQALLARGCIVVGIDNLNDYYAVSLKKSRLDLLYAQPNFEFHLLDIVDNAAVTQLLQQTSFICVIHLAAQAGVRYSLENPKAYIDSNLVGFANILEGCRHANVEHLLFASSSSVYGANQRLPFSVADNVDHPLSLYAATKKSNELMAHTYAHLYQLPVTGLRFFTVYGPWGRPDMALFKFTAAILAGDPIDVYNYGNMQRDFTYVDDIVKGIVALKDHLPEPNPHWDGNKPDPSTSQAPYRIYNIGAHQPVELMTLIRTLETALGKKAEINLLPMQAGDLPRTCASVDALMDAVGFSPATSIEEGVQKFVAWYRAYYRR